VFHTGTALLIVYLKYPIELGKNLFENELGIKIRTIQRGEENES